VPYPRSEGRTGSAWEVMAPVVTAMLDRERCMRGSDIYRMRQARGLFEAWRSTLMEMVQLRMAQIGKGLRCRRTVRRLADVCTCAECFADWTDEVGRSSSIGGPDFHELIHWGRGRVAESGARLDSRPRIVCSKIWSRDNESNHVNAVNNVS
jgi:hypothetical protein